MLKVTNILNPLTGGSTTEEYKWEKGQSLAEYIGYEGECVVTCGDKVIDLPVTEIFPADGEEYTFVPILEGGDKQLLRVLSYVGLSALMFVPGTQALAWHGFYISNFGKALIGGIGGNLINLFLHDEEKNMAQSPSYAWQHKENPTAAFGSAMPVIYGKARVRPTLKNRYITVVGDKQELYALYSIAAHKVDETTFTTHLQSTALPKKAYTLGDIVQTPTRENNEPGKTYRARKDVPAYTPSGSYIWLTNTEYWEVWHGTASFAEDIIINGRSISNFGDDVKWETRPGLAQQTIIDGFEATYGFTAVDSELYRSGIEVEEDEVNFSFSKTLMNIKWNEHYIKFDGEQVKIKNGHYDITPESSHDYYLYYEPDSESDEYEIMVDASPTASGTYVVAKYTISWISELNNYIQYNNFNTFEGVPAETDYYEPIASLTNVHNIELRLDFPYGLYGVQATGEVIKAKCRIFAQYREYTVDDSEEWTNFYIPPIKEGSDYSKPYTTGEIARVIDKKKTTPFTVSCFAVKPTVDYLDTSLSYEFRVVAASPSTVKLIGVTSIVYGELNAKGDRPGFTYPGEPLLGIKALASGQINGDLDVQVDVERSKVWAWNPNLPDSVKSKWQQVDANNHAWAVYDILVNGYYNTSSALIHPAYPDLNMEGYTWTNETGSYTAEPEAIYGCGINPARIDFDSFNAWGTNINDLEYELNIVFDTFMTAWDAILRICQEGRGMVYPVGTKIFAMSYEAQDATQLFTMGNIHTDTFVQRYMDSEQKANMLEIKYWDAERQYEETLLSVKSADWDESTTLNQPTMITLHGTTDYTQASKTARFIMETNRLLNNIISFAVDVDALASQVGDVVEVQHAVIDQNAGCGGRVVSATSNAVVIDQEFTLEANVTYTMEVRHTNGVTESNNIIVQGAETTTNNMGFTTAWTTTPATYEPFSIFKASDSSNKYQIIEISRSEELVRTLTLMQYDAAVYGAVVNDDNDHEFVDPLVNPGDESVGTVASILNLASNVQLKEVLSKNRRTGELQSSIAVTFDSQPATARGSWEIYFRDVDVSDINWKGTWVDTTYSTDEKVELNGVAFISLENNNTTQPAVIEA